MSQNNSQAGIIQNPRVTWEGCSVLLDINDGDRLVFARLSAASTLKLGNKNFSLQPLIGCPFGSSFQIEIGDKGPFLSRFVASIEGNNAQEKEDFESQEISKDNRALVDNNKAQSLTCEDIDAMRRQGATGDEIVDALIKNSATFEKKTLFSQEKYKLKKQKKYAPKVLLRRPVARSICEAYFKKYPARIGFLRVDTLSLLLSMANVSANSDVLVVDMVGGLLTGAVAERLGGTGYVCGTYLGGTPYPMDIVRIFNFSDEVCNRIVRSALTELSLTPTVTLEQIHQQENELNMECLSNPQMSSSVSMEEISPSEKEVSVPVPENAVSLVNKMGKSTKAGNKASRQAIELWKENGFSSLIIAAPELDIWSLLQDIWPLLSNSAPFAIYHQYLQVAPCDSSLMPSCILMMPLATCMHNLQLGKMAIGLQISEPWLREYQVLPSRTHPCMQMNAFGGYILSGTKICSS
ncbi:tRNA (adenine(58)-N(1))-methyltransferase non-catalytic subunit trm6 isoform X1 [Juglans microcarpa x Juglans regia]|uniref:tRNA (adenine(58)-N(1))-methyltransferase non-catalytic subunit trm6 isoform X1 n=1 Tax=Juglans microcarpa x Juglans regia TaxID=2249226 RepID=UPI001B7F5ACA|nr:tRNA (adenine(58)-N(1))-methyltransferase non-catalytic subunit trm6 isoform X1 [Juglans microcarpa x Juglans regia]